MLEIAKILLILCNNYGEAINNSICENDVVTPHKRLRSGDGLPPKVYQVFGGKQDVWSCYDWEPFLSSG